MKLVRAKVTNFRSVEDSNEFTIDNLTCLVGKNESGKTAILEALYGLNPFKDFNYNKNRDYPRRYLTRFNDRHPEGESTVVETWWELTDEDMGVIKENFGENAISSQRVSISAGLDYLSCWKVEVEVDELSIIKALVDRHKLAEKAAEPLLALETVLEAKELLTDASDLSPGEEAILNEIEEYPDSQVEEAIIDLLIERMPKMFYTSHYDRISGKISVNQLDDDRSNDNISNGDQIFLDFLEYAGTSLADLKDTSQHEELKAKCEAASNDITDEIFEFWSQNKALEVEINVYEGHPDDDKPFNSGSVVEARIRNYYHRVSVPLSERSAGFLWFFSFLAQFKKVQQKAPGSVILLDEPGLSLHGKAQSDLLKYIIERLLPNHQVIYTTHSPFMVPPDRLQDIRVVEDVIENGSPRSSIQGTKVSDDVLTVDKDTLFPLQAYLGYEITQTLFIGENVLLVEGPSDILYLQAASNALKAQNREGLDTQWTICPSGGIDKLHPFVSLFGGHNIKIAVLSDYASGDKNKITRLRESKLIPTEQIFTAADFTGKDESDIEDFFEPELFVDIVNLAYKLNSEHTIKVEQLQNEDASSRQVKQVEKLFMTKPSEVPEFDHFTPSAWLIRNMAILDDCSTKVTKTLERFEKAFKKVNALL